MHKHTNSLVNFASVLLQVMKCEDNLGSDKLSEVLAQVGGRVIPVVTLLNLSCSHNKDSGAMRETFAFNSSIGYMLSSQRLYRLAFPVIGGLLQWEQGQYPQIILESSFFDLFLAYVLFLD